MENSSIDTYTKDAETLEKKPMNKVEVNDLDYVKVKLSKVKKKRMLYENIRY